MQESWWLTIPFGMQALIIGFDEGVFHLRRGLPRWERIGHPLDTATVLGCILFVLWTQATPLTLGVYAALAAFSCLFVTKDEFVHKECCPAAEQWLHALLFLNHPVLLSAMGLLWAHRDGVELPSWCPLPPIEAIQPFLISQAVGVLLFLLYQILYWNFLWRPPVPESTTISTTS